LNLEDLQKYDVSGIHKIYDIWPEIAQEAYQSDYAIPDFKNIEHIVFSGMGGSGAIGDVLAAILSKTNIHVTVVKGYLIPKTVDSNTLVVTTSISGNTAETLTTLESAIKKTDNVISFSDGGKMKNFCDKNHILHQNISIVHSPRATFPKALYCILKTLRDILPISSTDIVDSLNQIKLLRNDISSSNLNSENPSLSLANWIKHTPVIYYPWGLQSAAIRFKNSIQENAKTHVISEDVIEACHNGIMSWERASSAQPILIQGSDDYVKTKERWKILKEFFDEKNIEYYQVFSVEDNILSKLFHLIYLFDYATIYLAIKNKIDPTPITAIDFIKNKLG
jgi:glucose/mannose-6-phosphate isomerase